MNLLKTPVRMKTNIYRKTFDCYNPLRILNRVIFISKLKILTLKKCDKIIVTFNFLPFNLQKKKELLWSAVDSFLISKMIYVAGKVLQVVLKKNQNRKWYLEIICEKNTM